MDQAKEHLALALATGEDKKWLPPNWLEEGSVDEEGRAGMVDWMVEIATYTNLSPSTLHLATALLDRALAVLEVEEDRLQLLTLTSLYTAAKVEEDFVPSPQILLPLAGNLYSKADLFSMEITLVSCLQFQLRHLTPFTMLHYYLTSIQSDSTKTLVKVSKTLMDLVLYSTSFSSTKPSVTVATVLHLSSLMTSYALPPTPSLPPPCPTLMTTLLSLLEASSNLQGLGTRHKTLAKIGKQNINTLQKKVKEREKGA